MHEMAIAQGIWDIVSETATRNGAGRVTLIKLQIGAMAQVEPEALRFCFTALTAATLAEGAVLEIETTPLVGRCGACGREFGIEQYKFLCPACGSGAVDIISGRELRVEHLEVE